MPRSNRPRVNRSRRHGPYGGGGPAEDGGEAAEGGFAGFAHQRVEEWNGEDWCVRHIAGQPGKSYRCPGCDQEIRPATGHVVAWPEHAGADARRHWHAACWSARDRRAAKIKRSRNGPRY